MKERKVIIMRGPPGSGKSTHTKKKFPKAIVCSADHYFMDQNGNYKFDASEIKKAHLECQENFKKALKEVAPLIVVDNTNTRLWEFENYVKLAKESGCEVRIIRLQADVRLAIKRNIHNVPEEKIREMHKRFESHPDEEVILIV